MLNVKDKKILLELIQNSRINNSQISKKLHLDKGVVLYRINKLKEDIFIEFISQINTQLLGFKQYSCLFELHTFEKEDEIIQYLIEHRFISNISKNIGRWSIIFDIFAKSYEEFRKIVREVKNMFKSEIKDFITFDEIYEQNFYLHKFLGSDQKLEIKKKVNKELKLDEKDKRILKELSINSRIDLVHLSQEVNLTPNAVKYRIKNLRDANYIQSYSINFNFFKLGYSVYNLQFKINSELNNEILNFIERHKKIIYFYHYKNSKNKILLDLGIIIDSIETIKEIQKEITLHFSDKLDFKTMHIMNEFIKINVPKGVFE